MQGQDLRDVANLYKQWRDGKKYKSEKTPTHLIEATQKLCSKYQKSKICRVLGLSGAWFNDNILAIMDVAITKKDNLKSLSIPAPHGNSDKFAVIKIPPLTEQKCEITLQCASGKLSITINSAQLKDYLPTMILSIQ